MERRRMLSKKAQLPSYEYGPRMRPNERRPEVGCARSKAVRQHPAVLLARTRMCPRPRSSFELVTRRDWPSRVEPSITQSSVRVR
jgi:hypothetical protein